jgi:hypothetical protein
MDYFEYKELKQDLVSMLVLCVQVLLIIPFVETIQVVDIRVITSIYVA